MPAADQNIVAGATTNLVVVVIAVNPVVARAAVYDVSDIEPLDNILARTHPRGTE